MNVVGKKLLVTFDLLLSCFKSKLENYLQNGNVTAKNKIRK